MPVTVHEFDQAVRTHFGIHSDMAPTLGVVDLVGWDEMTDLIQEEEKVFLSIGSVEVIDQTDVGVVYRLNTEEGPQFFLAVVYIAERLNPKPPPKYSQIRVGNLVELVPF